MDRQVNDISQAQELYQLFGKLKEYFAETTIKEHMNRVADYVYDPFRQTTITDYNLIQKVLHDCWKLTCVEVNSTIHDIGPLKMPGSQLGRCSVRILHFLDSAQYYIVLNQAASAYEKRLALLHEVGHFIMHFEIFQSMGTLYHRICMNPGLEFEIGQFIMEKGQELSVLQEEEADLFALTWLVPLWLDGAVKADNAYRNIPPGLSPEGYKFKVLRDLFSDRADLAIDDVSIPALNERGEEKSRREKSRHYYPIDESLVSRMSWLFFNRSSITKDIVTKRDSLMGEYLKRLGIPRNIPELKDRRSFSSKSIPDFPYAWIPRIKPDDVENQIDLEHWEPLLAWPLDEDLPEYYIPIRPVRTVNPLDSQVRWQHMAKANYSSPYNLTDWITRARQQGSGLLIFPRNPAEKLLDQQRIIR